MNGCEYVRTGPRTQRYVRKRGRRYKKRQKREDMLPEDMLKYLREHNIRSQTQLERVRKPTDPNSNDFRKKFDSWSDAIHRAFGSGIAVDYGPDYLLKTVIHLGLWDVKSYRNMRRLYPKAVPSFHAMLRKYKTFRSLKRKATEQNLKATLEEYEKLMRKLDHLPNVTEARAANLNLDEAIKFYGSKKAMDEFILSINKRGNS